MLILIQIVMILFVFCNIGANYAVQKWAYVEPAEQKDRFEYYLVIVLAFSFGMGLFILMRVALLVLAQLKTSRFIHDKLITQVF